MHTYNHNSSVESSSETKSGPCVPCSEVAALIVNLNDLQVCEAVRCLLSRAERVDPQEPKDKIYFLDLLTVPQVASTLHKSEEWVRRHKRELGVITLGGCGRGADLLFARAAINTYVVRPLRPSSRGWCDVRARGTGSVHRRPGRAAWYIKYYDQHGRPHRESSGSAVRADAERLLRRRLGEVAEGRCLVGRERERTTFDDLERLIVDDYRMRGRKSLDSVQQSFRALRRGGLGGRRACDIGYDDLVRYAAERGSARATIRRELPLLHRALVLAHRAGRLAAVPPFPTITVDNARSGFFESEQWQSIRAHLPLHLQDVGNFAYLTGWRVMEIFGLRWSNVDFERGLVSLPGRATKNGRARVFPFRDFPELDALLTRRRARTDETQRAGLRIVACVFHGHAGEPLFGADGRPRRASVVRGGRPVPPLAVRAAFRTTSAARRFVISNARACRALRQWRWSGTRPNLCIGATTSSLKGT